MRRPATHVVAVTALAVSASMLLWMARPLLTGQIPFSGDLLHFQPDPDAQ